MKVQYFKDTDTLYIEFRAVEVVESRDLDAKGNICAMTMEHAKGRADVPRFTFEEIAA
jgi:uncharacterized protein YuzE